MLLVDNLRSVLYDTANGTAITATSTLFPEGSFQNCVCAVLFSTPNHDDPCPDFNFLEGDKDCPNFNFVEIDKYWD